MKEQETKKKKTGLIIGIIAAVIVLAGGGITLGILGGKNQPVTPTEEETTEEPSKSEEPTTWQYFWNVDRYTYAGQSDIGMSSRAKSKDDGLYHVLFAVDGRQVTRRVQEKKLVNIIDNNDVMGLVFDENNVVCEVKNMNEISNGYAVAGLYFDYADEDGTLHFKTSSSMNGQEKTYKPEGSLKLYDVSGAVNYVGIEVKTKDLVQRDRIFLIKNLDDTVTTGFIVSRYIEPKIYWNVNRQYDSELLSTTREPNAEGIYEIEMAVNGELVTVKTKLRAMATAIDKNPAKCVALEFDMEGYVTNVKSPATAYQGKVFGSWAHVFSIDYENNVYAKKVISASDQGTEHNGKMASTCRVFNVSGSGAFIGEETTLQVYDQIHAITNAQGEIAIIFVVGRASDSACYWNVERKWDYSKKQTTRVANSKGLYAVTLAHDGTNETYYVTKEIANIIDSHPARCFGLKFEDGEIVGTLSAVSTRGAGGSVKASWFTVTKMTDATHFHAKKLAVTASDYGEEADLVLASDCEIINGSQNFNRCCGEYTSVKVGDQIHCITNVLGEVRVVFIVNRPIDIPLSWNETRMYDSVNKVTTRTPDENGYYVFDFLREGQRVTYKTKSKELATQIDSSAARLWAFKTSGDVITKIYKSTGTKSTSGGVVASWYDVTEIDGNKIYTIKNSAGSSENGNKVTVTVSSGTKIFNVSGVFDDHAGEKTTVRVGDMIHCLKNDAGVITYIFVVSRKAEPVTKVCPICGEEVTFQPFNGVVPQAVDSNPVHYYMAQNLTWGNWGGFPGGTMTHLDMNGKTLTGGSGVRMFYADANKKGAKLVVFDGSTEKKGTLKAGSGLSDGSNGAVICFAAADSYVTFKDITIDLSLVNATAYGAIYVGGGLTLDNVTVKGGTVTKGGSIVVPANKIATLLNNVSVLDGQQSDGSASNLYLEKGATLVTTGDMTSIAESIGVRLQTSGVFADATLGEEYQNIFKSDIEDSTIVKEANNTLSITYTIASIAFTETEKELEVGVPTDLTVTMFPVFDETIPLNFTSGDETCVLVDENGQVIALKAFETPVKVTVESEDKTLSAEISLTAVDHTEGAHYHVEGIHQDIVDEKGTKIVYQPWESETELPLTSGYFYLTKDIVLTQNQPLVPANTDLHICLNGHTVTQNKAGNIQLLALFYTGSEVSICDCSEGETGKMISEGTYAQPGRTIWVRYGTLNIYGGTFVGSDASTKQGGAIAVDNGATFNMYGGTLSGGSCNLGGTLYVNGTANILGGTIENGVAPNGNGGCIFADASSNVTIKNATIKGGNAKTGGGNIRFNGKTLTIKDSVIKDGRVSDAGGNIQICGGTVTVENTTISGGTASSAQKAEIHINGSTKYAETIVTLKDTTVDGGILLQNAKEMILSGKTVIGNSTDKMGLIISNSGSFVQKVTVKELDETAKIYVSSNAAGKILYGGAANIDNFVSCKGGDYRLEKDGEDIKMTNEALPHKHCVCGGTIKTGTDVGGGLTHTCSDITWTAWESTTTIPTATGNYYLTKDIVLTATQTIIRNSEDVKICLNGHNITLNMSGNYQIYALWNTGAAKLAITDCTKDVTKQGTLKTEGTQNQPGRVIWLRTGSTCDIYAGTIIGADAGTKAGGAINVSEGSTLNIFGGTIKGVSSLTGPALYSNGVVNMYGGTIQGGTTTNNSGSAYWQSGSKSVTNMYGGEILGGTVNKGTGNVFGGTMYLGSSGVFNQKGGHVGGATIVSTADWRVAGAIYIDGGAKYNLSAGTITGSENLTRGGCIDVENGTLTITGGDIIGSHVTKYGGAILVNKNGIVNMSNGRIYGGVADLGAQTAVGQNVAVSTGGQFNQTGGTITLLEPSK